MHKLFTLVR